MYSIQEFAEEYPKLIESIFDIEKLLNGGSWKKIQQVSIENLLHQLQTTKEKGLDDQEKILYNQKYFGGRNLAIEYNSIPIFKQFWNYFQTQIFLWMTLLIPIYQLTLNQENQSKEEYLSYKYSLMILIIIAIYNLIIEFKVIQNKNGYLQDIKRKIVQVIRGEKQCISCDELVVGDVLLFKTGDIFPVDGILLEGTTVMVDESFLTQKNDPLYKLTVDEIARNQTGKHYYCNPFLFSGTKCVNGSGRMLVMTVGKNIFSSKLQLDTQQNVILTTDSSKINGKIYWLNYFIITIILFIIMLRFYYKIFNQNNDTDKKSIMWEILSQETTKEMLYFFSIFFFTIPISLPLQILMLLQQLSKDCQFQQIRFQNIKSIEQLVQSKQIMIQDINQINKHQFLKVQCIYLGLNQVFLDSNFQIKKQLNRNVIEILTKSIWNNSLISSQKDNHTNQWKHSGDNIECALINFSSDLGKEYDNGIFDEKLIIQKFYNQKRQCMSSVYQSNNTKKLRMYTKGEANLILNLCKYYISNIGDQKQLAEEDRKKIQTEIQSLLKKSPILIAIAYKDIEEVPIILTDIEQEESNLTFICILIFEYTLKTQGMQESLKYLKEKNISLILENQIDFGQIDNFKYSIDSIYPNSDLIQREMKFENYQKINRVIISFANLEQIIVAIKNSEIISQISMEIIVVTLQNNITILNLILAHFLNFGNNPFVLQQIIYFSIMFDIFLLFIKLKQYCYKTQNQYEGENESDTLNLQDQKVISGVICTVVIQFIIYLFIKLSLPLYLNLHYPNINQKEFEFTIFVHLIIFVQIIQIIVQNGKQNKLGIVFQLCLLVANSFILASFSDFFHLYKINYFEIKGLFIILVFIAFLIKVALKQILQDKFKINQEYQSFISKMLTQRIQYLHSLEKQLTQQEIDYINNQRNQFIKQTAKINFQEEKRILEQALTKSRDEQRKIKQEEEERKRKIKEQEEERQRKIKEEEEERKRKIKQEEEERQRKIKEQEEERQRKIKQEEEERQRKIKEQERKIKQEEEERQRKIKEQERKIKQEEEERQRKIKEQERKIKQEEEERQRKIKEQERKIKQEEEERQRKIKEQERKIKQEEEERQRKIKEQERKIKQEEEERQRKIKEQERKIKQEEEERQRKIKEQERKIKQEEEERQRKIKEQERKIKQEEEERQRKIKEQERKIKQEEEERQRKIKEQERKIKQEEEERQRKIKEQERKIKQEEEERQRKIKEQERKIKQEEEERQRKIKEQERKIKQEEEERQRKIKEQERKIKQEEEERQRKIKEQERKIKQEEEERQRKIKEEEEERQRKIKEEEEERQRKIKEQEEERQRKIKEQERKIKEEEEERIKKQQEIERQQQNMQKQITVLVQIIQTIQLDQKISYNNQRYQFAKNSQKLIKVLLDTDQAVKIKKPTVTDLEIKDVTQNQEANVKLNVDLALFVLKESFSETVEVVSTSKSVVGGLESLFTGQNIDQSCFRFTLNMVQYIKVSKQPNFSKEMYLEDFKEKISNNFKIDAKRVEILGGFEENSQSIDFKIEGKENLNPEEQQFLQTTFNGTLEHYKYFQQAIDKKNKNLQPNDKKYIGLSKDDFNPKYNMTWKNFQESSQRGPLQKKYTYYFPKTCVGYGLQVANKYENDNWLKMDGNPGEWRILFHGTKQEFIVDITIGGLRAGTQQFYQNDQCLLTGQKIGVGIYFSDKIEVCRKYATPVKVDNKNISVYFMSRVRPEAIRQSERMKKINYFVVNDSKDIRPYRILLEET
ncbi:unnamed protein product [Paramecium sonneborni]|uniref:P-type ATPase A domain-containing protein n=1 Tax=Paramecium sonneborni TaxID=65129 RepID=A0A8S1RDH0_9CILI|nr:unnamed protein product [Paramecium sonneborni]